MVLKGQGAGVPVQEREGEQPEQLADAFSGRFSLRHPAVYAAGLHLGSYALTQGLRFASNLVLARLLVPEDFGLMLLVNLMLHGLEMFSDLGIGHGLIQHKRGAEPAYLRTAWTLGLARGVSLWVAASLLAWPLASFYDEPRLLLLLPVAALILPLDALSSSYVSVLQRRLQFGRLMALDIGCYIIAVAVMISGALYTQSVWPLVAGMLVNSGLSSIMTHLVLGGTPMRLALDRAAVKHIIVFGRWLFISGILTFSAGQMDRILLGKLLTVSELGVYAIAFMMAQVVVSLMHELSQRILYPVYARSGEVGVAHFRAEVRRYRIALMLLTAPPALLLYLIGPELIRFLYDHRYWDAGWILQVLAVGALVTLVVVPAQSVLIARGDTYRHMLLQGVEVIAKGSCIGLGYYFGGTAGLLVGFALSGLAQYPFLAASIQRHGVWLPGLDLTAVGGLGILLWVAQIVRDHWIV